MRWRSCPREVVHQQPQPIWDENGMLTKGVLVRHLVLPGHTGESIRILQYLHEIYGESIILSIMNQYTPLEGVELPREISRKLTRGEYKRVVNAACLHGNHTGLYSGRRNRQRELYSTFFG